MFPFPQNSAVNRGFTVPTIPGDANVGKTCVVQRFKTGSFTERLGSTIGVDFSMKTLEIDGKRVKVLILEFGHKIPVWSQIVDKTTAVQDCLD